MRKASEILLDMESKLDEILGHLRNNDSLLKNLANRISKLEKPPSIIPPQKTVAQMPGIKAGVNLGNSQFVPSVQEEEYEFLEAKDDEMPKGKRRDLRYVDTGGNTVVQQKIHFANGQPLPSAKVEIFTISPGSNSLVLMDNKKTNTAGKWSGALPPGNYIIKVFKKGSAGIPTVNAEASIVIPESNGDTINLTPIQVK
jgi:hypothetical protein